MALKLRVISDHYKALGKRSSRLFGVSGGRIGRAQDNDWILPDADRYVSSHHCKVSFRTGQWYLEDTSTNGVFINGADTPSSSDGPYMLKDGDRLRVGDYEIIVSIDERNDFSSDASGQMPGLQVAAGQISQAAPKRVSPRPAVRQAPPPDEVPLLDDSDDLGEAIDITDLLSDSAIAPATNRFDWPEADEHEGQTVTKAARDKAAQIAANRGSQNALNSLLDGLSDDAGQHTVTASKDDKDWQMQTRPYDRKTMTALTASAVLGRTDKPDITEPPRRSNNLLNTEAGAAVEAFCRGAGVDPSTLPADTQTALLTLAGQMLREVVLGLMEALKGRADLKSKLRLAQTTIQPGENNPLKFSASVDEAVKKLLDPHSTRYLGPIEAIRESFADLRTNQLALAAAIQAATDELMNRIEPSELQERFDRGLKRGALLGAANKLKYWDLYNEFYQVLNQRNEQGLPAIFAEELARTYAEKSASKKK